MKVYAYHMYKLNPERLSMSAAQARIQKLFPKPETLLCTDCGDVASEYDHYDGYAENWNKVDPVCRSCHMKREYRRGVRGLRGRQILIGPRMEKGYFFTVTLTKPSRCGRRGRTNADRTSRNV